MNKKSLIAIAAVLLIVLAAGALGYAFLTKKPAPPSEAVTSGEAALAPPPATSSGAVAACDALGLPEGSYVFEEGACLPSEAHQARVMGLAREEDEAGDDHQLIYIKNVYEKSGDVYIDADAIRWLSHSDGSCVILDEESQPAEGAQTVPACNPNGFLIVNDDPAIQTFKLAPTVTVRLLEEFGNIPDLRALSPQELMKGRDEYGRKFYVSDGEGFEEPYYVPFRLILKQGEVLFVHQVYVP
jgi:hypothetical protein